MKSLPQDLQDALDSRATRLCFCWKVTRQDGVVQGFTDHDFDLTFDGVTYLASSGFTATASLSSLGLAVDNLDVQGALSSASLNEDDLARGLYDLASVVIYWVDWSDVSVRTVHVRGTIGEVSRTGLSFKAELRGLANALQQRTGSLYKRYCQATIGDARCGIDLTSPEYLGSGTVVSVSPDNRTITVSGLNGFINDWFTSGFLTWSFGDNQDIQIEVKSHIFQGGTCTLELWRAMPFQIQTLDTFEVTVGCYQDAGTCHSKFDNIANFRGFNLIPGRDALLWNAATDPGTLDGGSLFVQGPSGVVVLPPVTEPELDPADISVTHRVRAQDMIFSGGVLTGFTDTVNGSSTYATISGTLTGDTTNGYAMAEANTSGYVSLSTSLGTGHFALAIKRNLTVDDQAVLIGGPHSVYYAYAAVSGSMGISGTAGGFPVTGYRIGGIDYLPPLSRGGLWTAALADTDVKVVLFKDIHLGVVSVRLGWYPFSTWTLEGNILGWARFTDWGFADDVADNLLGI